MGRRAAVALRQPVAGGALQLLVSKAAALPDVATGRLRNDLDGIWAWSAWTSRITPAASSNEEGEIRDSIALISASTFDGRAD